MAKLSQDEQEWQAKEDARTMARYQEILSDSSRRTRAIKAARQEAENLNKRVTLMNKVVNTKTPATSARTTTRKK